MKLSKPTDVIVRAYADTDRAAVRRVCYETGFMGEPVDWLWRDADSFTDMFSSWYVDEEPESAWVADLDGRVVGYLLGCRDTRRCPDPARIAARHVFGRGLPLRPGTAGFLWRSAWDLARDRRIPDPTPDLERWPAHLHIDLLPVARGHGVGRRLMLRWLTELRNAGIRGVHLGTFAENASAIAFFEAMDFARHGAELRVPGFRTRARERMHSLTMVRDLEV